MSYLATASLYTNPASALFTISKQRSAPSILRRVRKRKKRASLWEHLTQEQGFRTECINTYPTASNYMTCCRWRKHRVIIFSLQHLSARTIPGCFQKGKGYRFKPWNPHRENKLTGRVDWENYSYNKGRERKARGSSLNVDSILHTDALCYNILCYFLIISNY